MLEEPACRAKAPYASSARAMAARIEGGLLPMDAATARVVTLRCFSCYFMPCLQLLTPLRAIAAIMLYARSCRHITPLTPSVIRVSSVRHSHDAATCCYMLASYWLSLQPRWRADTYYAAATSRRYDEMIAAAPRGAFATLRAMPYYIADIEKTGVDIRCRLQAAID